MSHAVEPAEVPAAFERWLAGRPLTVCSRPEYARSVRAYSAWLGDTPDRDGWQGDPMNPRKRSAAARRPAVPLSAPRPQPLGRPRCGHAPAKPTNPRFTAPIARPAATPCATPPPDHDRSTPIDVTLDNM